MKSDPLAAYVETKRIIRHEKIRIQKIGSKEFLVATEKYISVLNYILNLLEKTKLISTAKPELVGYKIGDRSLYSKIFTSTIRPDFMFTKLMATYPEYGEEVDAYSIGNTEITIFTLPD